MIGKRDELKNKEEIPKAFLETAKFERLNFFPNPSKMGKFSYWQEKEINLRTKKHKSFPWNCEVWGNKYFFKLYKILGIHVYPWQLPSLVVVSAKQISSSIPMSTGYTFVVICIALITVSRKMRKNAIDIFYEVFLCQARW